MKKTLNELPDCKMYPLTIGKQYEIRKTFGNGYVILSDDLKHVLVVLQSRFS